MLLQTLLLMINDIIGVTVVDGFDSNGRVCVVAGGRQFAHLEQIAQIQASQKSVTRCHFPGFILRTLKLVRPLYRQPQKARKKSRSRVIFGGTEVLFWLR